MTKPKDFIDQFNTLQILSGLDFGDKTIGIAICNKTKTMSIPIMTLKRQSIQKDIKKLLSIFREYNVFGVVFGLPLSLDGSENKRTEKVKNFAKELEKNKPIRVTFYDERYSTDVIYKDLRKNSIPKNKIKKKIDQFAASYILQGFLDNAKFNK